MVAVQVLIVPQAIPGTLPTATKLYQPPCPNLPHLPCTAQPRKYLTFASQLCRSFSSSITPLGGPYPANASSAGIRCTPHPPQPCSAAWLQAKLLPISHPESRATTKGLLQSSSSSQGQRVCSPPCSEHTGTMRPRERKGPLGMHLLGLTHPHLPWFIFFPRKPCPSPSWASLSGRWDSASCGFQVLDPLLCIPPCNARFTARCQLLLQLEHWSATSQEAMLQGRSGLLPMASTPMSYVPLPATFPF